MTGRDLISASLRLIGVLAEGESPSSQGATDGLSALNALIDSWSNEGLLIHAIVREEFSLTAGDQQYSMGTGGDFSTTRPTKIVRAGIEDQSASPAVEYPLDIYTVERWAAITQKETGNSIPTVLYPEGTYPTETLNFWPKPSGSLKAVIYSEKPISQISTLDTSISLPPGYERALKYNLAIEIAPEYGKSVAAEVAKAAEDSLSALKRANHKPRFLRVDPALLGRSTTYDIMKGGST